MEQVTLTLKKAMSDDNVEDGDGLLTPKGVQVVTQYARTWLASSTRDLALERAHPDLTGLFYDVRSDADLCRRYAAPDEA